MKTKTTKIFCGLEDWEKQQIKDHELDIAKKLYFGDDSGQYYNYKSLGEYANDYGEREAILLVQSIDGITFLDDVEFDNSEDLRALVEAIDNNVRAVASLSDFTQKELEALIENGNDSVKNVIDETLSDYVDDCYLFDFLAKHNLYDEFIKYSTK
jgi:hypothetical protein